MLNTNGDFTIRDKLCGDKSITHRALILCALARGKSSIANANICLDTATTMSCLTSLGARFQVDDTSNMIYVSPIESLPKEAVTLYCGNSGTTARLLAGVVAGLGISATFTGDDSLVRRPMDRIIEPLRKMGCNIYKDVGALFTIYPSKLVGIDYTLPVASA
ncbi:MAG: 3-phosphoshikimate 1-carboxyvinyltransferase, partial [Clostridia bacterium]